MSGAEWHTSRVTSTSLQGDFNFLTKLKKLRLPPELIYCSQNDVILKSTHITNENDNPEASCKDKKYFTIVCQSLPI